MAIDLLSSLVGIQSVNPSLVHGGHGEAEIAAFVVRLMESWGLETETQEPAPGRINALARLPGSGGGKSLILNAHTDTVGLGDMESPLELRVDGDRAYGRGAYDMKGSLTAILLAVQRLATLSRLRGDVIVMAVADEEYASIGTEGALGRFGGDAAVVTEPTGLEVCVAHKGFAWIEIETRGRAAHGSKPELGVDAIGMMAEVLCHMKRLDRTLRGRVPHALLGPASLHASLIEGGQELSSYPAKCTARVERRTLPGETRDGVLEEVNRVLHKVAVDNPEFRGDAHVFFWRDPFEVPSDSALVKSLCSCIGDVLGREPSIRGDSPWMDSALMASAGIPTVVFGPGGGCAHGDDEWVNIADIPSCANVLVALAQRLCV